MHDDDEAVEPLEFFEELGDHGLPDNVRRALVLACFHRFVTDGEPFEDAFFSDSDHMLSKAAMFHGPFDDLAKAMAEALRMRAIVVSPHCVWTDSVKPHYVVTLSN